MMMMTSAQVVKTSVNVTTNSPSQDYTHPDDHNLPTYDVTPGFKPFTIIIMKRSVQGNNKLFQCKKPIILWFCDQLFVFFSSLGAVFQAR